MNLHIHMVTQYELEVVPSDQKNEPQKCTQAMFEQFLEIVKHLDKAKPLKYGSILFFASFFLAGWFSGDVKHIPVQLVAHKQAQGYIRVLGSGIQVFWAPKGNRMC